MQVEPADQGLEDLDSLAQFLVDNPDGTDKKDDEHNPKGTEEDNPEDDDQPDDGDDDDGAQGGDDDEAEDDPNPAPGQKFKVTVKGDDGADQTIEVDQSELISGYQRHADYTRKTQALAEREREAYQLVTGKVQEARQHYTTQAQQVLAVLHQIAGVRSPDEMAQLAHADPSGWVAENQRQQTLQAVMSRIGQSLQHENTQREQQQQEALQADQRKMGETLMNEGFDIPKFQAVLRGVNKGYGYTADEMMRISDPRLVRMMRDAVAYQELQAKKSEVVKKAKDAPRLPAPRQSVPKSERADKAQSQRFRTGRATLHDLASIL